MICASTALAGVVLIDFEPPADQRGFFAPISCATEFAARGIPAHFEQTSLSRSTCAGTPRGMHFQSAPHADTKLARCTRREAFDVVIDLRAASPTFRCWISVALSADNGRAILVPPGFRILQDDTDILNQITPSPRPGIGEGVRSDDPVFAIAWPMPPAAISPRDAGHPGVAA